MSDETTTEQLAEIDRDMADIERQVAELVEEAQQADYQTQELPKYTPPEGWRVLAVGEVLQPGDVWVNHEGKPWPTKRVGGTVNDERYIRQIEPQPVPESDAELRIRLLKQANDSQAETIGRLLSEARDLNMEIGGLERQLVQRDARIRDLETMHAAAAQAVVDAGKGNDKLRAQADELRSEVSYVQNLLGESRQRVTQLEELVVSLRTINEAQEKAFEAAGKENTALRNQLAAVKAELVTQAETSRRLQIELDAAQQVPADSPELRQLRAELEQVTRERDEYRYAHDVLVKDANTVHERTKAMTVEAIVEWLEPIRLVDHPNLSNETLQHLPSIMRSLAGLNSPEDVD